MAKKDKKKKQAKADPNIPLIEQFKLEHFFIDVTLSGIADILFDKFHDHSKEKRPPDKKVYLVEKNKMVLPNDNLESFLSGDNPAGAIRTVEKRDAREYLQITKGHINIVPGVIPFVDDDGKQIKWKMPSNLDHMATPESEKFYIFLKAGRTGPPSVRVKQEAQPRPAMRLPWNLNFTLSVIKNDLIDEFKLEAWFRHGGLKVGLCNNRPKYGRFWVSRWDVRTA